MRQLTLGKPLIVALFILSGLLFVQFARSSNGPNPTGASHFSDKVNLALRRTAHYLMVAAGDSTTRIPPVEQRDSRTWLIRIDHSFNYDRLPALLQESFDREGIKETYDVAVLDCNKQTLELGYRQLDFIESKEVPCSGRESGLTCATVQVLFTGLQADSPLSAGWLLFGSILLLGLSFLAWYRYIRLRPASEPVAAIDETSAPALQVGNSSLDTVNQTLVSGGLSHNLTYRESKLLQLFVRHPNQLLERAFILKSVWEDEGILVGRSVDVFVSRLRKMLKDDPAVKLVAVHGVGYRLEIKTL
jgi:DNA-binding winged helix-turn-helix (wHTH) protein